MENAGRVLNPNFTIVLHGLQFNLKSYHFPPLLFRKESQLYS